MDKVKVKLAVTGPAGQVAVFLRACHAIETLCNVGASRDLVIPVDGDGSGALRFEFKGIDRSTITAPEITASATVRVGGIGE